MVFLRFIHLFTFVFWYGTLLYFTFIQAPVLFKTLPRDIFGLVQSKLFPPFYILSYICGTALIVTYHFTHPLKPNDPQDCVKITALYLMLLLSLGQGMWIGPKAAQLRLDRMAAEEGKDTSKAEALNREFRKAHGISSLINLLVILSGLVYLIFFNFERGTPSLIQRILG
jgi:hypothetical protein